ncbi:MAG: peroxide stress protein YaaA, partial [Erythrobacter sp.]|nr:peroxide stress protein YaaA [Erythrobacter sp.]
MLTVLSPAKKLKAEAPTSPLEVTRPRLDEDTRALATVAKKQSAAKLAKLMHISDNLAELNAERF